MTTKQQRCYICRRFFPCATGDMTICKQCLFDMIEERHRKLKKELVVKLNAKQAVLCEERDTKHGEIS